MPSIVDIVANDENFIQVEMHCLDCFLSVIEIIKKPILKEHDTDNKTHLYATDDRTIYHLTMDTKKLNAMLDKAQKIREDAVKGSPFEQVFRGVVMARDAIRGDSHDEGIDIPISEVSEK